MRHDIAAFRRRVWSHWKAHGRHELPWRQTTDPYRILVSEVMLQQTQVARVLEKYEEFLEVFPTVHALARAPLVKVLKVWSGMGYNRRAKFLREAAIHIVEHHGGRVPRDAAALRALPGIGQYTASAVRVFAFNEPDILIETNIRAVYIHHFLNVRSRRSNIIDAQIIPLAARAAKGQDPPKWNWALMDYGMNVKKLHQNPTRKSRHYVVQSKFEGSLRQVRGAVLRALHSGERGDLALAKELSFDGKEIRTALIGLAHDGLVLAEKGSWRIA